MRPIDRVHTIRLTDIDGNDIGRINRLETGKYAGLWEASCEDGPSCVADGPMEACARILEMLANPYEVARARAASVLVRPIPKERP